MGIIKLKLISILSFFLLLDFLRPLSLHFTPEFLFLGVLYVSLNFSSNIALPLIISFGVVKDFFSLNTFPLYAISFVIVDTSVRYLIKYFPNKHLLKRLLAALAILFYACFNSLVIRRLPILLILTFFIQSFFVFYIVEYFLFRWIQNLSQDR